MKNYRVLVEESTPGQMDIPAETTDEAAEKSLTWPFIKRGDTHLLVIDVLELDENGNPY